MKSELEIYKRIIELKEQRSKAKTGSIRVFMLNAEIDGHEWTLES